MKVAVGSDHRGLEYRSRVMDILMGMGHTVQDFGSYTVDPVDYPDIARQVSTAVTNRDADCGILICGTGLGMSMAANKVKGIRAALCSDVFCAQRARQHNDANVLCLGAERGEERLKEILQAFLTTPFEGGRHQTRLDKMGEIESSR